VYLHDLPDALAAVVRAWPTLPQGTRKKIISLAQQKEAT
jgi:hypothetical protein